MLYLPVETEEKLAQLVKEAPGDPIEASRRMLALVPGYGAASLLLGRSLYGEGKLDEAEAVLWEGLQHQPCRAPLYLFLAEVRTARNEADVLAKRIRHLALWKLSFEDEVPEILASVFEKLVGDEAREPETYERLARYEDLEVEKVRDPAEVVRRLLPFRLLNDLQREAPDGLSDGTLRAIIAEQAEACEPIFRNALRQWAREPAALDDFAVSMLISILGEISGPDAVDELLELATTGNPVIFPHVHWAIHKLGMRYSREVLERFRVAAPGAGLPMRCALAGQLDLLEDIEGDTDALAALLDGFETLAKEDDAPYLLAAVVYALMERGRDELAKSLAAKYESKIPKKDRELVREALKPDGEFMPTLLDMEIDAPDIEGVCLERFFLNEDEEDGDEEEDDEEEEFDGDEEFDDPVDLEPPAPKPGRNDPCWCGSGKKYKKCHLNADEEAERGQAALALEEEDDADAPARSLHTQLMHDILKVSREWHTDKDLNRAKQMYFGTEGNVEATEDEINGFIEWQLHDFRDSRTRATAIENYLRTRGPKLTRLEREHLESLQDSRFGIYEAENIEPGSGVHLHDLGTGDRIFVHDLSMSHSLGRWDVFLARVQFEAGRWVFAGNGSSVPRNLLDQLMETIETERRPAGQTKAAFIRANSHRLHRMVKEMGLEWIAGAKVVNNEGEEFEFGKSEYLVRDEAALLAKLRSLEELEEDRAPEPGTQGFAWLQPIGGTRRPFGYVRFADGRLTLEAQSRTRLQTGRGLLESHAGALLEHLGDRYTSVDEVKKAAGTSLAEPASTIPPEVEREVALAYKTQHYGQWVNDRLPALKGKTPREAVKTAEGRKAVIDLLRSIENRESRELRKGGPGYDVSILRRDLGLEEE